MKRIIIKREDRQFIISAFGCTDVMVSMALNYRKDTALARRIRKLALERGGVLVGMDTPKVETSHEPTENTMTQWFTKRVRLVLDRTRNVVIIYVDGKKKRECPAGTIENFLALQEEARQLAIAL